MQVDFMFIIALAFGVAGVTQWVKGFFPTWPTLVWRLILPVVCVGVAFAAGGGLRVIALNAILALAVSQICYEALISRVRKMIDPTVDKPTEPPTELKG